MHLWCDTDGDGARQKLPGSPFSLHVTAAKASASGSRVLGADTVRNAPLTAGDRLEVGIQLRDPFGNPCAAPERTRNPQRMAQVSLKTDEDEDVLNSPTRRRNTVGKSKTNSPTVGPVAKDKATVERTDSCSHREEGVAAMIICMANGGHEEQPLTDKLRPGEQLGTFSLAYELHVAGLYEAHLMLSGSEINGSPFTFQVQPAAPSGRLSTLQAHEKAPLVHEEYELLLIAEDKFSNKLDRGGANVQARALGPSASPATTIDYRNGTYGVKFTAGAIGEYRVEVRLDNVKIKGSPHVIMFTSSA